MSLVKQKHLRLYKDYTEQLIEDLSSPVILGFAEDTVQCPNCLYDVIHKSSTGTYNGTGPKPFNRGICPVCHGKGTVSESKEMTIKCIVNWVNLNEADRSIIMSAGKTIVGYFKIKSVVANYNNINNAKYIIIDGVRTKLLNIIKRGLKEDVTCVAYCIRDD